MVAPLGSTSGRNQKTTEYQALSTLPIALPINTTGVIIDVSTQVTGILPVLNGGTGTSTSTGTGSVVLNTAPTFQTSIELDEGANVIIGTTTGSQIGTSASQKIAFFGASPDVQPTTAITPATFAANTSGIVDDTATWDSYTIGAVVAALRREGLLA